jgi:2-succinyl-5-enolpyruvyl-6-hydroxy-3-cyclohexene-1-carboxylate synthase
MSSSTITGFDLAQINARWGQLLITSLARLGVRQAVIAPGLRSVPLALGLANEKRIETISVLDERSAGFFALGAAKRSHLPTLLVCTSGTATAHFLPAIIEAHETRIPLIVLTADRPPELREIGGYQTTDQVKLYGHFPNWQIELGMASSDPSRMAYLRQTASSLWERALAPSPGPVHANVPFREPLVPNDPQDAPRFVAQLESEGFFDHLRVNVATSIRGRDDESLAAWTRCERGLVLVGPTSPPNPSAFARAVGAFAERLGWPVLADAGSPLRAHASSVPGLVAGYKGILSRRDLAEFAPEMVVCIGKFPVSKELRTWLSPLQPRTWVVDPIVRNVDPLHLRTTFVRAEVEELLEWTSDQPARNSSFLEAWLTAERHAWHMIDDTLNAETKLVEPHVAWSLARELPPQTRVFFSNSMPVRDAESFWAPGDRGIRTFSTRGVDGIDGIVSTALGIASDGVPTVALVGDLAFLHDLGGTIAARRSDVPLTLIVVDNDGGGIFNHLPIAAIDPPFERLIATPQGVDLVRLCRALDIDVRTPQTPDDLREELRNPSRSGIRVILVHTDRRTDAAWRRSLWKNLADSSSRVEERAPQLQGKTIR